MKKYFITGLIILLPLAVTVLLVRFFFNLLTEPFVGIVGPLLAQLNIGYAHSTLTQLISQILVLIVLFLSTVALGILTRWFFVHSLLGLGESVLHRIPLISPIYKTCKDVINTLFSDSTTSFKQVVMVPFPTPSTSSIGLVTRDDVTALSNGKTDGLVAVFVPTTPNPTSGFLIMFPRKDLVFLDMSVEEALKFVISCGVIMAPLHRVNQPPADGS